MRKHIFLLCASLALVPAAYAQVSFTALDLSSQDKLLFDAVTPSPDFGTYRTLLVADVKTRALRQLTFFPEEVLLLQQKEVIQFQNRFGVFRSQADFGGISPIPLFHSFVTGSQIQGGRIAPMQTSPDGRFLLYLRQRSPAFGDLTLLDVSKGEEVVISGQVELSLEKMPAMWSPDSSFIVYAKSSALYYFSLVQLQQGRTLTESLRRIGEGTMSNVWWSKTGTLHYIDGSIVYAIDPRELFTRALYAGFLTIGRIEGRIPFDFDPNFDRFWVAPDDKNLLLDKADGNVFLYTLGSGDFHDSRDPTSPPYLYLPRDTTVLKVLWSAANVVTLLCEKRNGGKKGSVLFRLAPIPESGLFRFQALPDTDILDAALSPNEGFVALMREGDVVWKDYASWKDAGRADHPAPLHVIWLSDDEVLIAGAWYTERRSIESGRSILVSLSQVEKAGYSAKASGVVASSAGKAFSLEEATGSWMETSSLTPREATLVSASYRVYQEASTRGSYADLIMARDSKGFGTVSLIPAESIVYETFPTEDQPVDFANFMHGSRIRRREVSLVFNVVDSVDGLTEILNTLSAYGLRCTFFVNGEFIRRYPDAVREIAQSGHEVGSLFSTYFNMTDARFRVDDEFIKTGLARNEDDYYAASGRELSLLWHAPYYIVNSSILSAGASMNYTYVGRDLDTYDWVSLTDTNRGMGIYLPAAALVDRIIAEKKPGSIIPILVGPPEDGRREDYLFQKVDLVVNELTKLGYDVVPVSSLMEHAR